MQEELRSNTSNGRNNVASYIAGLQYIGCRKSCRNFRRPTQGGVISPAPMHPNRQEVCQKTYARCLQLNPSCYPLRELSRRSKPQNNVNHQLILRSGTCPIVVESFDIEPTSDNSSLDVAADYVATRSLPNTRGSRLDWSRNDKPPALQRSMCAQNHC